ncbi:hypothetical protein SBRCBS47491_008976 [Sporothrix bragantina]|uniref:Wings apart-like protein C-terminal domain-containing protein n=1 Tax=Sporothrix bragantina TaxID=671064 RepID=A0ABP0CQZ0_9PEZI
MATMATYLDTTPTAGPIYRHGNSDILPAWSQREAAAAEQPWTATRDPSFKYRGYYQNSLRLVAGNTSKSSTNPCMDADWATLFRSTPTESRKMYEAIFRATEALIRTTTCSLDSPRKSNSLLAMCLRKVPQYVAACEEAEKEDAEKERALRLPSSSVSLGIYTDLESLGSDRGGWKHLRTVVRQHGIHILESACAESLLHDTFVRLLVRLCTHMKAYDEAESLMTALFAGHITSLPKGQYLYEKPDKATGDLSESTGPVASLGMLLQYMEDTGRTSAPLQQITSLLNDGHLPPAWLSTPAFSNLWHRVIRLLSSRGSPVCDDSILLGFTAAAVTCLVLSQPDDDIASLHSNESRQNSSSSAPSSVTLSSSYHTLVSILGSISAVAILQHEAASGNNDCERSFEPAILKRLSLIAQSSLTQVSQKLKGRKGQNKLEARLHYFPRQVLLMLSVFLLQPNIEAHEAAFQKFVEEASAIQKGQVYDATIALVTSVAENCGRASKSFISGVPASRSYLLALCTQGAGLISSALDYDSESSLAARLQADAAFLFASRSNDLRDLAFAENLGKNSVQTDSKRPTPSGASTESEPSTERKE